MAVKSAADPDPYFSQRQLSTMKQRNYKHAMALAQLRKMHKNPNRPAFLKRRDAQKVNPEYVPDKMADTRAAISRIVNKHIDSVG